MIILKGKTAMDKSKYPLKVALHGMDERSRKMMTIYLQGPCKGIAVVVNEKDAEIDMFDADGMNAGKLLHERLAKKNHKPLIVLSLQDHKQENILYLKKPVKMDNMLAVLEKARILISKKIKQTAKHATPLVDKNINKNSQTSVLAGKSEDSSPDVSEKQILKTFTRDTDEQKKTSKHQAAMQLNEHNFGAFIGNVPGIDVNDPKQFAMASYNPKDYFQGYVESAFKISQAKGQIRQLNSGWNPLIIFPHNNEVWLDADEKQLRAFAGLTLNNTLGSKMSITPMDPDSSIGVKALEKFYAMDAFLWKLACWASKGRYPATLDIKYPVYLKSWPNFTRLLVTPHALRISALLIQGPRTLTNVAEVLNIKPQYVFVFISAAYALGLVGQAKREADELVLPPEIRPNKEKGLLSRIISKLRGNKV
jgi:hypothetical protein